MAQELDLTQLAAKISARVASGVYKSAEDALKSLNEALDEDEKLANLEAIAARGERDYAAGNVIDATDLRKELLGE